MKIGTIITYLLQISSFKTNNNVGNISRSEIEIEFILDLSWNDVRLNTSSCYGFIDNSIVPKIWTPQIDIYHKSYIEKIDRIGGASDFFSGDPDYFYWAQTVNTKIKCQFDFTQYPFDRHLCSVIFESFFHKRDAVVYNLGELDDRRDGIQHKLKYDVNYSPIYDDMYQDWSSYSRCGFHVKLTRKVTPALANKFLPSLLIIMIAFCRYKNLNSNNESEMKHQSISAF